MAIIQTTLKLSEITPNPKNPRVIKDEKYHKLVRSLKDFPEMLDAREVIVNSEHLILGGNMRYKAALDAGLAELPVKIVDWSSDKQDEFIAKDNVNYGDWDWDMLVEQYDIDDLSDWGITVPTKKNTALLSGLEYKSMYYEPEEKPTITLEDCVDLSMFNVKMELINSMDLADDMKNTLKLFAYRFIKIDFESVANYYYFNASEEEQKAIERLRLVLIDDGAEGFIEDDLIKILGLTDEDVEW